LPTHGTFLSPFKNNTEQSANTYKKHSNKAQLRELEHIRTKILHSSKPLPSTTKHSSDSSCSSRKPTLQTFLVMARFVARMRISAHSWAKHEAVRQRLAAATEEQRRVKRNRGLKVVRA
jgi:hypothetical protein